MEKSPEQLIEERENAVKDNFKFSALEKPPALDKNLDENKSPQQKMA